jgi:3-dehydroquinate dehydratase type I
MSVDIKYCLPLIKSSKQEVLEVIQTNDSKYSYFEVWLDYVVDVDEAFVKQLAESLQDRLVILFRRQQLEPIQMNLEQRYSILEQLSGSPVLVDLDFTTQTEELEYIKQHQLQIKMIVSYHNYQLTPDSVQLKSIIGTITGYQPSIYKLAAQCASREDALRLLEQLLELRSQDRRVIVSGMGEFGVVTRVFGALWGNEMTFAPLTKTGQSAPGQLTRGQLENIFKELES